MNTLFSPVMSKMSYFKILLVFNLVLSSALSARILGVFPFPSISHQIVFRAITNELVKRGHEVTVLTPDPAYPKGEGPKNLIEIDAHDISYRLWSEIATNINGANAIEIMIRAIKCSIDIFEKQINSNDFKAVMKNNTGFDLIIAEALVRPALVFSHVFNAPVIHVSSAGAFPVNHRSFGIPTHPFIYPEIGAKKLYNLSMWDKMDELYGNFLFWYLWKDESIEDEMLKRNFGEQVPSISELINNVDLALLNLNTIWACNRAVPPGVIQVSGLHLTQKKDLPEDLKSYLDKSEQGVIYMSFGTNFEPSILPPVQIEKFNKVFARLPYDVIWKWNKDVMTGKAHNVRLMKWVPQADLLHHPKIKVFITHGGLQSTDEAIVAEVPLIAFPNAADQWYNSEQYTHHKIGIQLDLLNFSEDELYDAVTNVIGDKSYRQNIKKLSNIIRDTPDTALNTSVWWIEYVIRHGGAKHLRSRAAGASWSEYLMLDVVFTVLIILVLCLVLVFFTIHCFVSRIKTSKEKMT